MNILVFDIETVPDIASGKKLYNLDGLTEEDAAELMFSHRRQETDGKSDFYDITYIRSSPSRWC